MFAVNHCVHNTCTLVQLDWSVVLLIVCYFKFYSIFFRWNVKLLSKVLCVRLNGIHNPRISDIIQFVTEIILIVVCIWMCCEWKLRLQLFIYCQRRKVLIFLNATLFLHWIISKFVERFKLRLEFQKKIFLIRPGVATFFFSFWRKLWFLAYLGIVHHVHEYKHFHLKTCRKETKSNFKCDLLVDAVYTKIETTNIHSYHRNR